MQAEIVNSFAGLAAYITGGVYLCRVRIINLQASGVSLQSFIMAEALPEGWQKKSADSQKAYREFLRRANARKLLRELPALHEAAFEKIDCLQCAACCKNYSPRFKTPDIKRISKHLKMKESNFIDRYLKLDEDGDYVTRSAPCPFLGSDNFCSIYEQRPSDCQRFPYTDEDVFFHRPAITLKNTQFCPITWYVMDALLKKDK